MYIFYVLEDDLFFFYFFFSSRRRHTRCLSDWSSDVCSSDLAGSAADRLWNGRCARGGKFSDVGTRRLAVRRARQHGQDRKSTRLNSSHLGISYAVFCLKKKKTK